MSSEAVNCVVWGRHLGETPRRFTEAVEVTSTDRIDGVTAVLQRVEAAASDGLTAVGFIAYEAAAGLDPAYATAAPGCLPLAWFGLFRSCEALPFSALAAPWDGTVECGRGAPPAGPAAAWEPSLSPSVYGEKLETIRQYLKAGDTYQVNFTMRMTCSAPGDPWDLFLRLQRRQHTAYAAYIETGDFAVCSASPELFFSLESGRLVGRPMKGTTHRGAHREEDARLSEALRQSQKNRAENVMIVDMVRNDMGRIADAGSVQVEELCRVEEYPTVHQMTSTVCCRTSAGFTEVIRALFPCASITGAPKVRTMEIIRELENGPRGVYTGALGVVEPRGRAVFNVAIRTAIVDKRSGAAEYGVGGGIVWDSVPEHEYRECLLKAAVLEHAPPDASLLETMLWEPGTGYAFLDAHLARLRHAAGYFNYPLELAAVREALAAAEQGLEGAHRIRLTMAGDGRLTLEAQPAAPSRSTWRVAFAREPVDPSDCFLYHKTTNRQVYEKARAGWGDVDDVLLWNPEGQVTESTIGNVVAELDGKRLTPPVSCGLLPGVFRAHLLAAGEAEEGILTRDDVRRADRLFVVNSVRRWMPAKLVEKNTD